MAKGKWKRDPVTGLTVGERNRIDEELLTDDGRVDTRNYPDCNVFTPQGFAKAAGYKDRHRFFREILTDPSSPFHAHQLKDENGKVLRYFTHSTSAESGGKQFRHKTLTRQTGWEPEKKRAVEIRTAFSGSGTKGRK